MVSSSSENTLETRDSSLSERGSNNNLSRSQWLCCNWNRRINTNDDDEKAASPVSMAQFLSFSLIKFLLEVCGAAGAVWGFCEIMEWRHIENTDDFRGIVSIAFVVFAIRWYWHVNYFWHYGYDEVPQHHRSQHWYHGLQVFGAKFVLQVCGAAGAVWGASETTGLRHPLNRDEWQIAAWITTVLFGIRWSIELFFFYCRSQQKQRSSSRWYHALTNNVVPLVEVTITNFVLEVCGSTGAVWGFADILTLRDQSPDTATGWRITALVIGSIFFLRWIWQVNEYLEQEDEEECDEETIGMILRGNNTYGSTTTTEATPLNSSDNDVVLSK